jgi:limonene-1,2-epoxide hydrolase
VSIHCTTGSIGVGSTETFAENPRSIMTTKEIADRLVSLCREGKFEIAQKELFATDVISIEPFATPAFPKETRGLSALLEKGQKFTALIEQVHALTVSEPLVAGDSFVYAMQLDATIKGHGRMSLDELCLYEVKDGKIVSEQFTSRFPV